MLSEKKKKNSGRPELDQLHWYKSESSQLEDITLNLHHCNLNQIYP